MKYLQILILLCGVSVSATEPETETEETREPASGEKELLEEMSVLWEKIGPHAEKGSKLAKDNWTMFDAHYRRLATSLTFETEQEPVQAPRPPVAKFRPHQEICSLMCMPTPYGWPDSRPLKKDIDYTGLVLVSATGEYEVLVEVYPEDSKAILVLEIDGKAIDKPVMPNQKVTVRLEVGVRALSVSTSEVVQLQFHKFHLDHIAKK
jgi:hypothetical protein